MSEEREFNLLHEKWILVMKPDGEVEEVSLVDVFRDAHSFRGLAGELPTQDVSVLRLLLAILHAVFSRYDLDGTASLVSTPREALTRWKSLWDRGSFPKQIVEDYLLHYEERFWLFHPKYPFYQVAPAEPVIDSDGKRIVPTIREASQLIGDVAESDNKTRLFSSRTQKECASYSEAARWIIYTNLYDVAPGGRPSDTGITIKGYGLSWLSQLGLVWVDGASLFETLMLNFVPASKDIVWKNPSAVWENDFVYDGESLKDITPVFPEDPCGLLTMQFRQMQLIRSKVSKCVTGYWLWSGRYLDTTNAHDFEMMTLWQKNKQGDNVPKQHEKSRQMWRDFSAIFSDSQEQVRPGVVEWIHRLKAEGLLELPMIQLNTAGVEFRQRTAIADVFTDSLRFNAALLSSLNEDWVSRIINMVGETEALVKQVGFLAQNLAKAAGLSGKDNLAKQGEAAQEQAYHRLDSPFRRWLEEITPSQSSMNDACNKWRDQAKAIVRALGKELVDAAGPQAIVGRYVKDKGKEDERRYTAAEVYNRFLYWTSKILT